MLHAFWLLLHASWLLLHALWLMLHAFIASPWLLLHALPLAWLLLHAELPTREARLSLAAEAILWPWRCNAYA